ncbi:hypothetical protein E8E12_004186 [Didymella heteroderae]|uniref:Uncharacterized protein n=1 Tax=Didymella heteroderae TaxID=1769908 RepID=A0A9P5BW67_9PLEO|nr:hypothetical protein E8E12_004186 [Didymella heteroderae]
MKHIPTILALAGVTVLAIPTPQGKPENTTISTSQGEASTFCGYCNFGGVGQDLVNNSPKCTPFNKFGGSSVGTCVNLNCRICMFFKNSECKDVDFSWSGPGSPYFSAYKYNSYSCDN